jgi:hypothetical protein
MRDITIRIDLDLMMIGDTLMVTPRKCVGWKALNAEILLIFCFVAAILTTSQVPSN